MLNQLLEGRILGGNGELMANKILTVGEDFGTIREHLNRVRLGAESWQSGLMRRS